MFRFTVARALVLAAALCTVAGVHTSLGAQAKPPHDHDQPGPDSWTLPPAAEQKKNPLTVDAKVLAQGKSIFKSKCQKCHGPNGKGDGPDADPEHQENMDLTRASRASKNPDGVMFYKVSNGRKKPKMQAFKDQLTEEQIWAVVAYAQSLRK